MEKEKKQLFFGKMVPKGKQLTVYLFLSSLI